MSKSSRKATVAIVYPREREASRFAGVSDAFAALGAVATPAPYHDDDRDAVRGSSSAWMPFSSG